MFLDSAIFSTVIDSTPLISIDLLVIDEQGRILLGLRNNRPAKGFWFVPGGRILKNETLESAFKRLSLNELGVEFSIHDAKLLGPFTHLYTDSVFDESISTHYVAIAYELRVSTKRLRLPKGVQHDRYQWLNTDSLLNSEFVHEYTKQYFSNR